MGVAPISLDLLACSLDVIALQHACQLGSQAGPSHSVYGTAIPDTFQA